MKVSEAEAEGDRTLFVHVMTRQLSRDRTRLNIAEERWNSASRSTTVNDMDWHNLNIPEFFDAIIVYLEDTLPPPLDAFFTNIVSRCLALISAFISFLSSLLAKNPNEWDVQTVLPPLITILAAYFALLSLYRTTTWLIRTAFWFIKWTIIVGAFTATVGWYVGATQNGGGGLINKGLISYVGNILLDVLNGNNLNAAGGQRTPKARSKSQRPKAWESFDRHQEWQYDDNQATSKDGSNLEIIFQNVMNTAGSVFGKDSWWGGVMQGMNGEDQSQQTKEDKRGRARGRTRTK